VDPNDPTRKTTSFLCSTLVSAQHVGFAIGPFEYVNLAAFRESDEDDKLGGSAIPLHGFCLPGRAEELRNTCMPLAKAMDLFVQSYGRYPYSSYKLCFLDNMIDDRIDAASLSLYSSRMLFPDDIIDPLSNTTREIVYGLACQWCGVDIIPKDPEDTWIVVGIAYYITDIFMQKLMGRNEYRWLQTKASERVCEMDMARPSIYDSGRYLSLDKSHMELIAAKAPLVLFILDRRLIKTSGSSGLSRIISRVFLNASVGAPDFANGMLSTAHFVRQCHKIGHLALDTFFNQWVMGAGCPRFRVTQRFNKKRLVVEMQISQVQGESVGDEELKPTDFMRDVREDTREIYAGNLQNAFSGPMTIRIHEADGTPYEHIVEIKDAITRFEVPYSTKYKRLKRTRRHREKIASGLVANPGEEGEQEALLYCLGDVLQTQEEEADWRLSNWTKEDEDLMSSESYEWIRMDADFEWICKLSINMPGYMYVSQLQQDRDVSAQYDTIQFLAAFKPHPLISTFLVRTLMDRRYFHGIRTSAAAALAKHAKEDTNFVGLHHLKKAFNALFCFSDSGITVSNDFSDRAAYYVQCAILRSVSTIRDGARRSPYPAREFLYNKLRENDNSNNEFSDCYYVAALMRGLAEAQASAPLRDVDDVQMDLDDADDYRFHQRCIDEIDRHRRIDEWIPSYHNVVSIAALDCKRILAQVGSIPKRAAEFLQYTQEGTYEELRVNAFSNLVALGFLKDDYILRWFLYALSHDPSPYARTRLQAQLGVYLGSVAIGEDVKSSTNEPAITQVGGLIIEQDTNATTDARAADLARKQTIPGALAALKVELATNETLKSAIWDAINAPIITVSEMSSLLEVCDILYEPQTSMVVRLPLPRYWSVHNLGPIAAGNGKKKQHILAFRRTQKLRTKPVQRRLQLPAPGSGSGTSTGFRSGGTTQPPLVKRESSGGVNKPSLKIKIGAPKRTPSISGQSTMGPPTGGIQRSDSVTSAGGASTPGTPGVSGGGKIKLKFNFGKKT
jgi:transcription initiation factor TFIID subunit 2